VHSQGKRVILFIPSHKNFRNYENIAKCPVRSRRGTDIALKRKIPIKDVLHAYLARYADAMLVSRDHHFKRLADTVKNAQPEELL